MKTTAAGALPRPARWRRFGRFVLLSALGLVTSVIGADLAAAAPIYCYTLRGQSIYTGVTTPSGYPISPNGSFTDPNSWLGPFTGVDPNNGICYGKLPPQPGDILIVQAIADTNGILQDTTISGGGGTYNLLAVLGPPVGSVSLVLQTNGSTFTGGVEANYGAATFQGGLTAGGVSFSSNAPGSGGPGLYTVTGGIVSAGQGIGINGYSTQVMVPSGGGLSAQTITIDGDLNADLVVGGTVNASSYLTVGAYGVGSMTIQPGGVVTSGNGFIGGFAGSNGTVTVNGKWTTTGYLIDGQLGNGTLTVGAGGQLTTGDYMTVGAGAGLSALTVNSGGKVSLTAASGLPTDLALATAGDPASIALVEVNGSGSTLTINGALNVGYSGTGTMEVTTGGDVEEMGSIVRIGRLAGSTGTLNLTGANSKFSFLSGTIFQVGTAGTGNLNVTQGFQLNTGTAAVTLGSAADSSGTATISGSGSLWTVGGPITIGDAGSGTVTVSGGGSLVVTGSAFHLGASAGGTGTLVLSGANSSITLPSASTFLVGEAGDGNLTVNQGFDFDTGAANVSLGSMAGSSGHATVTDQGSSWKIGGNLSIGDQGYGALTVSGGGALTYAGTNLVLGNAQTGTGLIYLAGASSSLSISNLGSFIIGNAGGGNLTVVQGFQLNTGNAAISIGATGGNGAASVGDPGTTWTVGGSLTIGDQSSGTLFVNTGGSLVLQSGSSLNVGKSAGADGTLTLDGASSSIVAAGANVQVGVSGTGTLSIQNGATLDWSAVSPALGVQANSSGTIQVTSGGSFKIDNLALGDSGAGNLDVGGGSPAAATLKVAGDTELAESAGSLGDITIDGSSQATFAGDVTVGVNGTGKMDIDNASSVQVQGDLAIAQFGPSNSEVTVQHGSHLTAEGSLSLGSNGGSSLLFVYGGTMNAQSSVSMGGVASKLALLDNGSFSSTSSIPFNIGATNEGGVYTLSVESESQMTLAGGAQVGAGDTVQITVDGAGSTLTADYMNSQGGVNSTLAVTGGAQVNLMASVCGCTALTWTGGTITVAGGSALNASIASIGSSGSLASLTLSGGGSAAFTQKLMLQPGSTLNVLGGGSVVVGAPGSGFGTGQVAVDAGGTLKGYAGGVPPLIQGNLVIQKGGAVLGPMTIGGTVTNAGQQTLGDDPATVTVDGSYTLAPTGTLIAEVGPTSYSQLIVNGSVTLNGGTLEFEPVQGGMFQLGKSYDVLTAFGGVTGNFADVTVAQPAGMPFIDLTSSFVDGTLEVTPIHMPGSFASIATTPNQHAVGSALDRAAPTASGALNDLITALSFDDASTVVADFDPLSGEAYGDFAEAGMQANRQFAATLRGAAAQTSGRAAALTAFNASRQPLAANGATGDPSVWLTAVGGFDHAGGVDGSHSVRTTAGGLAGGIDLSPAPHWALGGAFGYLHSDLGVGPQGSGALDTYQGAFYAGYSGARFYVDAVAGYAHSAGELHRSLAPAAALTAEGRIQADQYFASGEAGVDLAKWNGVTLTPFATLDADRYQQAALTETGAAELGLAIDGRRTDSLRSDLGVQLSTGHHPGDGSPFVASVRLGWGHEFAEPARPVTAAFIGAPDIPFTVQGAPAARDFAVIGVGVGADLRGGLSLSARYDAAVSNRTSDQTLSLSARLAW
jgi:fibronectin-binding autotransporter adhesin